MSKRGPTAKRKYVTITVPQKHKIISRLESDESESVVMSLYNIWSSTVYDVKKQKHHLWSFIASIEKKKNQCTEGLFEETYIGRA